MKNYLSLFTILFSFSLAIQTARAATINPVLTPAEVKNLIGNIFPAPGSQAEKDDYKKMLMIQETRTQEQCDEAEIQANINFRAFFLEPQGPLTEAEVVKLEPEMMKVKGIILDSVGNGKRLFQRPRPYVKNPDIHPCIELEPATSFAFPSGHATLARVWAKLLSVKLPRKAQGLMTAANKVANNRVIGGVHHPADVAAAIKLADEISRRLIIVIK